MEKLNIKNMTATELSLVLREMNEKHHRTRQIMQWLYQKGATSFSSMSNLSIPLRGRLSEMFRITSLDVVRSVASNEDKSQKFLLSTDDGLLIESVIMEAQGHYTICISSQIGCPLGCAFCSTGSGGFERDLRADEILNQILYFRTNHIPAGQRFNIVFMGMGDPFLNIENVSRALAVVNDIDAFALREKRVTVSTAGFPGRIDAISSSPLKFSLAVSVNATTEKIRSELMPGAGGLHETVAAAERFARARKSRTTLEYVLIEDVNDSPEDAARLSAMTAGKPFKINLIPFNEWEGCPFRRPSEKRLEEFIRILLPKAPAVTVRRSQGNDISAACGQLRMRERP
ncbi:MAG: 23S rRNA (adenine(2503)-C(2))-methyltransferase RlmN [Candidatus Krumholzibacteria bacterium]|nr:23S rRNA (adenine(2503)-C(2))-methyltransferase RlmN [Candidatus Krumholzibacteria bacterium]